MEGCTGAISAWRCTEGESRQAKDMAQWLVYGLKAGAQFSARMKLRPRGPLAALCTMACQASGARP